MTLLEIQKEAEKLLRQYRDIPSLDKSKMMLISKYGEKEFLSIRSAVANLWLEQVLGKPQKVFEVEPTPPAPKQSQKAKNKNKRSAKRSLIAEKPHSKQARLNRFKPLVFGDCIIRTESTKDEIIAEKLLKHFGTAAIVRKYEPYISSVVLSRRAESILSIVDKLAENNGDFYEKAAETVRAIKEQKEKEFIKTVKTQNERSNRLRKNSGKPRGENYFKLIYIPMGNKR